MNYLLVRITLETLKAFNSIWRTHDSFILHTY